MTVLITCCLELARVLALFRPFRCFMHVKMARRHTRRLAYKAHKIRDGGSIARLYRRFDVAHVGLPGLSDRTHAKLFSIKRIIRPLARW